MILIIKLIMILLKRLLNITQGKEANPIVFSSATMGTSSNEYDFGDYNNVITTGDYNGDGLVDFIVMQPAQNGRPEDIIFILMLSTTASLLLFIWGHQALIGQAVALQHLI
jgi:hypothetical protein